MAKTEPTQTEVILLETDVQSQIYNIRGLNIMLDSDLATLYGIDTKVLNQAVRRNREMVGYKIGKSEEW